MVRVGLSLMIEDDFRAASKPLFDGGLVDAVEWSFDTSWGRDLPHWLQEILARHSASASLYGHGVSFSVLDAQEDPTRHRSWLQRFEVEVATRNYQHISEHFGFMSGENFHFSSPMPVPMNDVTIEVGRERLRMLAQVAGVPVGLENLAFAFGIEDVQNQGEFLTKLLNDVDGFIVLDLHNLYCQLCNFAIQPTELLDSYPLQRVRELHVSGGSWSVHDGQTVRRDTHDGDVPPKVFDLLQEALRRCENLQVVIMERLGGTFTEPEAEVFREDYRRIHTIVHESPR